MTWMNRVAERCRELVRHPATPAFYGVCDRCRHDWREHHPDRGCGECGYEIEHGEPGAPDAVCSVRAPGGSFV
ncbi:hypothetical protein Aph02nite_24580 [Actinoplanes philippinensis]|uniref:Uncharacterized protein n=1 Tax=Actinoplanes philippinensis TaxID=35752 RepID=A0A1I2G229_9ACTN|nr:hypothetical protein Aph02nite_24580 [Actinoplanes philippinensis]SFF11143.1 hypothetical protein SAMN05421541_106117 [Actinoplanes philippinensis]